MKRVRRANIAFKLIEKCIFNGGDNEQFKKWLRIRLDETIDSSRKETKINERFKTKLSYTGSGK